MFDAPLPPPPALYRSALPLRAAAAAVVSLASIACAAEFITNYGGEFRSNSGPSLFPKRVKTFKKNTRAQMRAGR